MAKSKIESISTEELEFLLDKRDEIIRNFCSDESDKSTIEAGVRSCYEIIGEEEPTIIWVNGPLSVLVLGAILKENKLSRDQLRDQLGGQLGDQLWGQLGGQLGDQLRGQLWDQLRGQLGDQLWDQLGDQLWDQLRGQLWDQLRDQLWDQLRDQLWDQLRDQLRGQLRGQLRDQLGDQLRDQLGDQLGDQLWDQLGDQLWDQLWDQLRGQLRGVVSSWWLAYPTFYALLNDIEGIEQVDPELIKKAESFRDALMCQFWLPMKGVSILSENHTTLHRDNRGRLHCENGPAWEWADGTTVYAMQGVRVPEWSTEENLDYEKVFNEIDNTEQRRVIIEAGGWEKAVSYLNLKALDTHQDPHVGTLYDLPKTLVPQGATSAGILVCRNASPDPDGTWRTYGLDVPGECRTVEEAQAALARLPVEVWRKMAVQT